ncbi:hypothetical protein KSS87_012055 [Heliosperma pusillum]|nr:hypothetical protein KSS87_012055 [Heliosperma pusillum]
MEDDTMSSVRSVVFKESENLEGKRPIIAGYDFNQGVNYSQLLKSFVSTGFQASNLGDAIQIVNQMLEWKLSDEEPISDCSEEEKDPRFRESTRCKVFLGFTSNLISSGVRDTVRFSDTIKFLFWGVLVGSRHVKTEMNYDAFKELSCDAFTEPEL